MSGAPASATTWSMTSSHWHAPPIAKLSTAVIHGFSRGLSGSSTGAKASGA